VEPIIQAVAVSPSVDLRNSRLLWALELLQDAFRRAGELQVDAWQLAVEIGELRSAGVTHTDLRWLVARGYAQHGSERRDALSPLRLFDTPASLAFADNTCFILTPRGVELQGVGVSPAGSNGKPGLRVRKKRVIPCWDRELRQLLWQGKLVKQLRVPAPNQELILSAFEEEGWPRRIDDPLPLCRDIDARTRLHDTVKRLNYGQIEATIHFGGDGTGEGVQWRLGNP
jgi:hypothetical protein